MRQLCGRAWWRRWTLLLAVPLSHASWSQTASSSESTAEPEAPVVTESPAAAMPGDAELESSQARIGKIEIVVDDIFDESNPKENKALYRAANALHINSRDGTVRSQLLFQSGDAYSRHVFDETARNLRARRYLNEATIEPTQYHADTNTVDVLVRVHDVWTLNPGTSYGRSGGENHSGLQLEEGNLLGFGKSLALDRNSDVDRSAWRLVYNDPNVWGSRWELNARYADASDGGLKSLLVAHPFYALDTRWGASTDATNERRIDKHYDMGVVTSQFRLKREAYGAQLGWSNGLRDGWVQRWTAGYRIERRDFEDVPLSTSTTASSSSAAPPPNVHLAYPSLALQWFEDRYEVQRNRDQVGRTEDVYYGRSFNMLVGYAAPVFGADRRAWMFNARVQDAYHLTERQSFFVTVGVVGRMERGSLVASTLSSSLRYDMRWNPKALFTTSLTDAQAKRLDQNQQLYLGGEDGMRGYPLRFRSGTHTSLLSVEQRGYTDWQILRLLTVGGAAFFDVGRVSGGEQAGRRGPRTFESFGVGLRLGNFRSARGEVFHIDLAHPMNRAAGHDSVQLSVSTKQSF